MRPATETTELSMVLHHKTARAVLVSDTGEKDDAVWLPLSQISVGQDSVDDILQITMPEWLAKDKGLI